jgi:hypothetical protein
VRDLGGTRDIMKCGINGWKIPWNGSMSKENYLMEYRLVSVGIYIMNGSID